jgi:hypothetical protein
MHAPQMFIAECTHQCMLWGSAITHIISERGCQKLLLKA